MVRPAPGGGGEITSAIDPVAFAAMVTTFGNNASTLQADAAALQADFEYFGIAPGDLARVQAIASWMQDQMAGLRRRQALAEALARDVPTQHTVYVPEPVLTEAQSVQAGAANANAYLKAGQLNPAVLADLQTHEADPSYVAGFYDTLGPQKVQALLLKMDQDFSESDDSAGQQDPFNAISKSFETYSTVAFAGQTPDQRQLSWNKWFDEAGAGNGNTFRPDLFAALLAGKGDGGNPLSYDARYLDALAARGFGYTGNKAGLQWMRGDSKAANPFDQDHAVQLLQGLTNNPEAAAEFTDQFFNSVMDPTLLYGDNPWAQADPERLPSLAAMLHAATIPTGDCNPLLAKMNAAHMILWHQKMFTSGKYKGMHPAPVFDALYGSISSAYFSSAISAITSPVGDLYGKGPNGKPDLIANWNDADFSALNGGLDGSTIQLPASVWQTFMAEGMRDPASAGRLGVQFNLVDRSYADLKSNWRASDNNALQDVSFNERQIQNFYRQSFGTAVSSVQTDIQTWVSQVNSTRDAIIEFGTQTLPGLLIDPEVAVPKGIADMGTSLLGVNITSSMITDPKGQLKTYLTATGPDLLTGPLESAWHVDANDNAGLQKNLADLQKTKVDFSWQANYRHLSQTGLPVGTRDDIIPVTVNGNVYNGDPAKYVHDPSQNFLGADGKPIDVHAMTVAQRDAYAAWLQDPAVQNYLFGKQGFQIVTGTTGGN